jgi:hypothetical protein
MQSLERGYRALRRFRHGAGDPGGAEMAGSHHGAESRTDWDIIHEPLKMPTAACKRHTRL